MSRLRSEEYRKHQKEYQRERYQRDGEYRDKKNERNRNHYEKTKCLEGRCHGKKDTGAWKTWHSMRSRVLCSSDGGYEKYKNCPIDSRWNRFMNFYEDMGDRPEGMTIDRKDNSKGYYKDNCRWATPKQQARNRNGVKLSAEKVIEIKLLLGTISMGHIALEYGVHPATISDIKHGRTWEPEVVNV